MAAQTQYECYSDDWRRTRPDLVLCLPKNTPKSAEYVGHVLVDHTPGGDLLATWTMAVTDQALGVVYARCVDGGTTFTEPQMIDGPRGRPGQDCSFGFPVVSRSGRIYCFYNWSPGIGEGRINAILRCKYSDDDGLTWTDGGVDIPYRRSKFDHPDPSVLSRCIVWQKPIRDAKGRQIVGLTRWTAEYVRPVSSSSLAKDCHCEFVRFDNIDDGPDPRELKLTWLQDDDNMLEVPTTLEPKASHRYSLCQEPAVALLPDGRLFTVMRTGNGQIWYSVSEDDGHTWRNTEMLRYQDEGEPVLNPLSPTPLFRLQDGRYLLFLQNHDGFGYGGKGPLALNSRRPQFLAVGEYREGAHQPLWFSDPMLLFDTQNVGVYPFYLRWLSMYASLTERDGKRILWYTDRKMFALGRYMTDEMLATLTVPR